MEGFHNMFHWNWKHRGVEKDIIENFIFRILWKEHKFT